MLIDAIHPGIAARRIALNAWNAVGRNKEFFTEAMSASKAYRDAMQTVQADYQQKVGRHFDLARVTIGRWRVSRYWALRTRVDLELLLTGDVDLSKRAGLELQLAEQQLEAYKAGTWEPTLQARRNKAFMEAQQSVRDYYAEQVRLEAAADAALEAYLAAALRPAQVDQAPAKTASAPAPQPNRPALQMASPVPAKPAGGIVAKAKALRQKAIDIGEKDVDLAKIVRQGADKIRTPVAVAKGIGQPEEKAPAGQLRPDPKPVPPRTTPAPETTQPAPPPSAVGPVPTASHLTLKRPKLRLPKLTEEELKRLTQHQPQPTEEPAPTPEQEAEESPDFQDSPLGPRFDPL